MRWWTCVRDHAEELGRLIYWSPKARASWEWAQRAVDDEGESCCRRALAFTMLTYYSFGIEGRFIAAKSGMTPVAMPWHSGFDTRITALAGRIRAVVLESVDAVDLLQRFTTYPDSIIYCDPPYAGTQSYAHDVDRGALTDALRAQQGRVAVSGYEGEWDHLGWEPHRRKINAYIGTFHKKGGRVEVLWTNYTPPAEQGTMDMLGAI